MATSSSHNTDTTTITPQDDINSPHHPLYFHPNDHPGLLLIAKKLNGSDNYGTWKRSMLIALSAKNKLKLINGEYDEPPIDSPLRAYWERANDMLISWILNTVSEQIGNHLTFVNSACALWSELQEHYSQLDGHRIYQLANEIVELKQSNCTIEVYYHKLKGLWDEIDAIEAPYACSCKCTCENGKENGEREQRKRLIQFLMGLDECYTNIRGQILLMQPLPLVAKAYSMLRQEEKQRDFPKHSSSTPVTLNTYRNPYTPSYRNNQPNTPTNPPNGSQNERRHTFRKGVFCGYCKKQGHPKDECYKLLGYPLGHPLRNKYQPPSQRSSQTNRGQRSVNMMTGDTSLETPLQPMVFPDQCSTSAAPEVTESQVHARMDQLQNQLNEVLLMMQNHYTSAEASSSTAPHVAGILSFSDHIILPTKVTGIHSFNSAAKMYSFIASHMTKPKSHFIWVVDSGATDHVCISLSLMHNITKLQTPITVYLPNGQITQVTYTGSVRLTQSLTLTDVFYIPTFTYNLISISRLLHKTILSVTFTQDKFVFQDHDGNTTHGTLHGGLYLLPSATTPTPTSSLSISIKIQES
ncbi:cysteine-rich receptor-like protein kinase 8 [Tanacetum coccineum]